MFCAALTGNNFRERPVKILRCFARFELLRRFEEPLVLCGGCFFSLLCFSAH